MTNLPFVSVAIPTRNRAALLRDSVDSLLLQDYPAERYEIVIVDDGSSDETPSVVDELSRRQDPPLLVGLRTPPRGPNAARNAAIASAKGDPICFVDDDIEAPREWLSAVVGATHRYPDAACIGGPIRLRFEGKAPRLCGSEELGETELDLGPEDRDVRWVWGANMAVRRGAIETVGFFCESLPIYGDETEWQLRLSQSGLRIVYAADAWLYHRRTTDDLRLGRLIAKQFLRGRRRVEFVERFDSPRGDLPRSIGGALMGVPRALLHAARRRCVWGLLNTATRCGIAWGLVERRRRTAGVAGREA